MKVTIDKIILQKCLSHIQGVVERRNTIPILSNVKLKAVKGDENKLFLTATDMDISISEGLEAEINEEGEITVPAHTLHDIVRKLPEDEVVVLDYDGSSENKKLNIKSKKSKFTLPVLEADEFPEIDIQNVTHSFSLTKKELAKLIDKSKFAISTEETRYYLNGIFLHDAVANDDRAVLRAVATDGHRLARVQVDLPEGAKDMPSIIIPRKAILEIKKIIDEQDSDTPLEVSISESKIKLAFGSVVFISKLIDGSFPDYDRVIPKGNAKLLETIVKPLTEAIDRVATILF